MHSYKKRANFYVSYFWSLNRVSTTRKRFVHVPNGKQMVQCFNKHDCFTYGWFAHCWWELWFPLVKVEKILDLLRWHHAVTICSFYLWHDHSVVFLIKMRTHHSYGGVFSSGQIKIKTCDDLGKPGKKPADNMCVLVFESLWKFFGFWVFLKKSLSAAGYSEHLLEILYTFSKILYSSAA